MATYSSTYVDFTACIDTLLVVFAWVDGTKGRGDYYGEVFRPYVAGELAALSFANIYASLSLEVLSLDGLPSITTPQFILGASF